jgi:hypothetical protein
LVGNAVNPLLILCQEKFGKPAHLLVILLPQGMLNHNIEVEEHLPEDVVSHLRRQFIGHLVLVLVQLDATEIIELNLTVNAELDFMLTSVVCSLQRE